MLAFLINLALGALAVGGRLWSLVKPAAPWILAAVAGAFAWHFLPGLGAGAQLDRLEAQRAALEANRDDWRSAARDWEVSWRLSEAARGRETATAQAAANALIEQCGARVEEARRSARVIERIVTKEPSHDATGCPVRELVDPGQLRDALSPGSAAR